MRLFQHLEVRRSPAIAVIMVLLVTGGIIGTTFINRAGERKTVAPHSAITQTAPGNPMDMKIQEQALKPGVLGELDKLENAPYYRIEAVLDPQRGRAFGKVAVTLTNSGKEPLSELVFRLYSNAATIYGGQLEVDKVTDEGGHALERFLSADRTSLTVRLNKPLEPEQKATISLEFGLQAPTGAGTGYGILSKSATDFTVAGWYPLLAPYRGEWITSTLPVVGDSMYADISFVEASLALPREYDLFSTGTIVSTDTITSTLDMLRGFSNPSGITSTIPISETEALSINQEWVEWKVVSGPVRELAAAAGQDFETLQTVLGGTTLRLHTLPVEKASVSEERALQMLAGAFRAYEKRFGTYPYNEFDLVETPITIGGYEFSGMAFVDDALRTTGEPASYEYILAHELAHQWWYGLAGNDTVDEPWLDEAHATYAAVLYLEAERGSGAGDWLVANWKKELAASPKPLPVNSSALDFTNWGQYRNTVYLRGALFLHALREEIGDEKFFELLLRYQQEQRYRIGSTQNYLNLAESIAGKDLEYLYKEWLQ